MLEAMLEFRNKVCEIYQKFQFAIDLVFKFIVSFLVLTVLNTEIGYDTRLTAGSVVVMLSILCAFTPGGVLALVCIVLTVVHVFSVNPVLALFVALFMLVLYAFFLRFTPKYAYIMIAVPVLGVFNIPYTVPLLAGLTTTPVTVFPMCCGIFFRYLTAVIRNCVDIQVDLSKLNTDNLLELVNAIVDNLLASKEMLWFMGVYAAVEVVVFVIRKLKFSFAFEISIIVGTAVNIVGNIFVDGKYSLEGGIGKMLTFSIISCLLVIIVYAFIRVLDYISVENVQFEDDDYYYYVRAVPKIKTGLKKLKIREMNTPTYFEASMESEEYVDDEFTDPETGEVLEPEKVSKSFAKRLKSRKNKAEEKPASKVVVEETPESPEEPAEVPGEVVDTEDKNE
ncbi:MAG: hypothetical protein J6U10_06040 [Lachnospiraceae bacterium]|nr:hypothetical protein [Lachnospiraceae bacterium]MBP5184161.1 hypothetical protein [Lachnospiraceae bacterium]